MKQKTILWDFNGTILDDVEVCWKIAMSMLEKRGMKADISLEEYRHIFTFPVIEVYYRMGYTFETERYEDVAEEYTRIYNERYHECGLVPGVLEKLQEARQKGYRNVIVSASEQNKLNEQCDALGIGDYFETLIGISDNMAYSKTAYAKAWMEQSGTDPEDCLMIGDTLHDLETARALKIAKALLVASGHQAEDILSEGNAPVLRSIYEVNL